MISVRPLRQMLCDGVYGCGHECVATWAGADSGGGACGSGGSACLGMKVKRGMVVVSFHQWLKLFEHNIFSSPKHFQR